MRTKLRFFFIVLVAVWIAQYKVAHAVPRLCSEVCSESTDCNTTCYINLMDFESGVSATCLDYGVYGDCPGDPAPSPGNGTAGSGQHGTCGNSQCDNGETCESCPKDCYGQCGGCGDSQCTANEYGGYHNGAQPPQCSTLEYWCEYCPDDCGECDPQACYPQVCGGESERYQCKSCTSNDQCDEAYSGAWCPFYGQCITWCYMDEECHGSGFGNDWFCGEDHECHPPL
jgi:hypothetical protein